MNLETDFRRWTFLAIGGGVAALFAIVIAAFWLAVQTNDFSRALTRARAVRFLATEVQVSLVDAETGQRGYLLTQNPGYLAPYVTARARLARDLPRLRSLLQDDSLTAADGDQLIRLADAKLGELAKTVKLAQANRVPTALAEVRTNAGKIAMDRARAVLRDVLARTESRVIALSAKMDEAAGSLQWVVIVAGTAILLFGAVASWLLVHCLRESTRARHETEALNLSLENRVVERTAALTRANEEIQRFAYIVSHDLRAPLVNIMGFTSELELGAETLRSFVANPQDDDLAARAQATVAEELPEAVRFIRISTGKMDNLINAILKLSGEGRRELNPEAVALNDLLSAAIANVQHRLAEKNIQLDRRGDFPVVVSDRLALEQIFGNLIDNALKYLSPGRPGHVVVEGRRSGGNAVVDIKDNGRGIAAQDRERIFELFRRAGAQDQPGEGIGLAHVRTLARRLGGDITVVSEIGVGSTFRVELPGQLLGTMRRGAA
ncbi:MAG: sensor histidine kinase [Rhizomicrobium sp.]